MLPRQRRLNTGRTNTARGEPPADLPANPPPTGPPPAPRARHSEAGPEAENGHAHASARRTEDAAPRRRPSPQREGGREARDEGARRARLHSACAGRSEGLEDVAKRAFEPVSRQLKAGSVSLEDLGSALRECDAGVRLPGDEDGAALQQLRAELLRAQCASSSSQPRPDSRALSARGEREAFEVFLRLARERGARRVLPSIVERGGAESENDALGGSVVCLNAAEGGVPLLQLDRLGGTPASRIPTSMSAREHRDRAHSSRLGSLTSRDGRSSHSSQMPPGPISSELVIQEVQRARAKYVPKSQVPRYGLNIAFKSSDDLKKAVVPLPKRPIDRSHYLPDDDRHITSYMVSCHEPATDGREPVIGVIDDQKHKKQHLNHMMIGLAREERVIKKHQTRDEIKEARKENRIAIRSELREQREKVLRRERPRPHDFDARKRSEVNRFHMSPVLEKERLEKKFKPYHHVEVHHNQEGSWSPSKETSPLGSKGPRGGGSEEVGAGRKFFDNSESKVLENKVVDLEKKLIDAKKEHAAAVKQEGEEIRRSQSQVNTKKDAVEVANLKSIREQRDRYCKALQDENDHRDQDEIFKLNKLRRHKQRWESSLQQAQQQIENPRTKSIVDSFKEQKQRYDGYVLHARRKNEEEEDRNRAALRKNQDRNKEYSQDAEIKKEQHLKEVLDKVARQQQRHQAMAQDLQARHDARKCKQDNDMITAQSISVIEHRGKGAIRGAGGQGGDVRQGLERRGEDAGAGGGGDRGEARSVRPR